MKSKTRQILATAIVTSTLSLLIGGFAVWGSYESETGIIDEHLNTVVATSAEVAVAEGVVLVATSLFRNSFMKMVCTASASCLPLIC